MPRTPIPSAHRGVARVAPDGTLGPIRSGGHVVRLRPARLVDGDEWRAIRLRDRDRIAPFWGTSALSWERRHTPRHWAREWLLARLEVRAGRRYSAVIEVDGQFTGQLECYAVAGSPATMEISCWIDARWSGCAVLAQVSYPVLDHLFTTRGVDRVVAPIAPGNRTATERVRHLGFRHEATMVSALDVGGAPRDHALWAFTAADIPAGGFPQVRAAEPDSVPRASSSVSPTRRVRWTAVLVLAVARSTAAMLCRSVRRLRRTRTVSLPVPGHPGAVVRIPGTGFGSAGAPVSLRVDGRDAAGFRLSDPDSSGSSARVVFCADPGHTDPALRAAALRAVAEHALGVRGLRRIVAEIPVDDTVSAALAEQAGFVHEGVLRAHTGHSGVRADHDLWARTSAPEGLR